MGDHGILFGIFLNERYFDCAINKTFFFTAE